MGEDGGLGEFIADVIKIAFVVVLALCCAVPELERA